ncbi:MAG: hypothetical protein R3F59_33155 [Myxococcota bacterium]
MIAFLLSTAALAAEPAAPAAPATDAPSTEAPAAAPKFEDLDVNKDLALDKTEVSKNESLTKAFATVDTDKNGKLSKDEFTAWVEKTTKG